MKYLFIVQGDGRGHMTQAITLSDILQRNGHEVVEVLVGKSKEREIPPFFVKKVNARVRTFETPSLVLKKNKKNLHLTKTLLYNVSPKRLKIYAKSIAMLHERIKVLKPDAVINFYEMLVGFTHLRYNLKTPIIAIGHQYLLRHPDFKFAEKESKKTFIVRLQTLLCNIGAVKSLGLSFYPMKDSIPQHLAVVPPLIRKEVRDMKPVCKDYILGYMVNQGYEKEVRQWHTKNPNTELHIFWDKKDASATHKVDETLSFHTLDDEKFLLYMSQCKGYITTAGFESVCEAMYLDKPIMMIPVHIEQEINAADAASVNAGIIGDSFNISLLMDSLKTRTFDNQAFKKWVDSAEEVFVRHLTTFV